jgi:hypothetical protein
LFLRNVRGETVPFFMKGYKKALPPLEGKGFEGGARELRPVEFPPGCEASDKGPATEFGTQKKPGKGFSQTLGVLN